MGSAVSITSSRTKNVSKSNKVLPENKPVNYPVIKRHFSSNSLLQKVEHFGRRLSKMPTITEQDISAKMSKFLESFYIPPEPSDSCTNANELPSKLLDTYRMHSRENSENNFSTYEHEHEHEHEEGHDIRRHLPASVSLFWEGNGKFFHIQPENYSMLDALTWTNFSSASHSTETTMREASKAPVEFPPISRSSTTDTVLSKYEDAVAANHDSNSLESLIHNALSAYEPVKTSTPQSKTLSVEMTPECRSRNNSIKENCSRSRANSVYQFSAWQTVGRNINDAHVDDSDVVTEYSMPEVQTLKKRWRQSQAKFMSPSSTPLASPTGVLQTQSRRSSIDKSVRRMSHTDSNKNSIYSNLSTPGRSKEPICNAISA